MTSTPVATPSTPATTSAEALHEEIFFLERELGMFSVRPAGVPIWERIRVPVAHRLARRLGLVDAPHETPTRTVTAGLRKLPAVAGSVLGHNPFRASPVDVVLIGHPRRKLLEDGTWWDLYCDPVIENVLDPLGLSSLVLERPFLDQHCTPARTRNLRHLDAIALRSAVTRRVDPVSLSLREQKRLERLDRSLSEHFGVEVGVPELARHELNLRRSQLGLYTRLLKRLQPRLLLLVVSYGNETIVEAARSLGIPTAELQHGNISRTHLGYSFPGDGTKESFPDHFLAFGDFWTETTPLPLPQHRTPAVGFPYYEQESRRFQQVPRREQIVFLSQKAIGRDLSRIAARLSTHEDFDLEVVYKLHPGEAAAWRDDYPELAASPARVIEKDSVPLYHLLAESRAQVGVHSTALYEGLGFSLETFVMDVPGNFGTAALTANTPGVLRVASEVDIVRQVGRLGPTPEKEVSRFFREDSTRQLTRTIETIMKRG